MTTDRRTFLGNLGLGAVGLGLTLPGSTLLAADATHRNRLPRSNPEAQGVSSAGILAFLEAVAKSKHEFHNLLILRHGYVVAEGSWRPYRPESPQMMYSLSKSFTSTAVGFAVAERRLKVSDRVISFFPEDLPGEISPHLGALAIQDLLSMSVGHAQDSTGSLWAQENWVKQFLSVPIQNAPGTAFLYDSGASYMLSAIVQKVTGQPLIEYLRPRLFEPLGIKGISWEVCPRGINSGGWGLKIQAEGIAKFAQLYLQRGQWKGKQLLPRDWIAEATSFKIQQPSADLERAKRQSDWHQGYCYQFWRCRHNAYRGDGAFGQFAIVMPEQDAVIAITSESPSMQGELDLIWEHILPAIHSQPLPANPALQAQLKQTLGSLSLPPAQGSLSSPAVARATGRTFKIEANASRAQALSFHFHKHSCLFRLKDEGGEYTVACGLGHYTDGETAMPGTPPKLTQGKLPPVSKVAASGAWKDDRTFQMIWRFYETPHHDTVTCRFDENKVQVEFLDSLAEMSPAKKDRRPPLSGSSS
jgi:CubicO group peptidase (beta-lactamase class C family)